MSDAVPLSLRQLQYFVAVVDEGSFTRAAKRLLVAQPSLSHQIQALEASVGTVLLERSARTVSPTPAGRALLGPARDALEQLSRARSAAQAAAGLRSGSLVIATTQSLAQGVLPRTLRAWRREHPHVEVDIREHAHLRSLHDDLAAGLADVALAQLPDGWTGPIEGVGTEELVIVVADDDALARHKTVRLASLADRRWVLPDDKHGLSETVQFACAQAGFAPRAAVRSSSVSALVELAAAGLGPALVPRNVLPDPSPGHVLRCRPVLRRPLALFAHPTGAHIVEQLATCVREHGRVDP